MAILNIGLTNAYAEDAKAINTDKIENAEAVPIQCSVQKTIARTNLPSFNSNTFVNLVNFIIDECEARTIKLGDDTVVVVESDCDITIIQSGNK